MPDFTRYTKYPKQVLWTEAVGSCALVTLRGMLGATTTSTCQQIYVVTTWNPLQVSVLWESRTAQIFSDLCWMLAVTSINSLPTCHFQKSCQAGYQNGSMQEEVHVFAALFPLSLHREICSTAPPHSRHSWLDTYTFE